MWARMRAAMARAREHLFRSRIAAEQDEEFRFHLEMEIEHHRRLGMSADAARRAALIAFGGQQRFREETRDARGFVALDNVARDTRFALRRMRRSPGFASGAVATLGIGIGAAVGIGSIVYGVLLRDLPYANPDALVRVGFLTPNMAAPGDGNSEASFVHFAAGARSFEGIGAYYTNDAVALTDGEEAERITAAMVTPATFRMLGVRPVRGALFSERDTAITPTIPILISQQIWERRYGADPQIIDKTIEVNRSPRRVVGVLPRSFGFPVPDVTVWYPATIRVEGPSLSDRYLTVVARLRAGVTAEAAEAELNALVPALSARYPNLTPEVIQRSGAHATVQSLKAAMVAPVRGQLVLLGVMVLVVLLIATTNVVNLFLLRTERATHEIAIALSLGATRMALARRFVVEGMVLGAASVVVALPVAATALATKFGFGVSEIPRLHEVAFRVDTMVLVVAAALAAGAAIGLTALTRTGVGRLADRLHGAGTGRSTGSRAWRRVQQGLVAVQIAFALALLVAAALLGRSFWNLRNAELGFDPAGATVFEVSLPYRPYGSHAEAEAFHARVIDRLKALPGVGDAAGALKLPLTGWAAPAAALRLETPDAERQLIVPTQSTLATPNYFEVMGIPLRRGRSFAPGDLRAATPAVVISERLARALFSGQDPLGRHIRQPMRPGATRQPRLYQVVGVAGDVHGDRIENGLVPMVYFPMLRDGDGLPKDSFPVPHVPRWVTYVVRASVPPSPQSIRALIRAEDARVPAVHIRPLQALVDSATASVRLTLLLLGVAGAAALLLGIVGVYSVVSYAAAGRLREFGVRLALGATPRGVASLVLHEGAALAAIGVIAGLAAALAGTRFLRSLLYEVTPTSVPEFVVATALLVSVTLLATLIPARRASRTDPAVVLRGE